MSDEFSGVPAAHEFGAGPPLKPDQSTVMLLALLAVVAAITAAIGRGPSHRCGAQRARIAEDWDQPDAGAGLAEAARRFIRPALAFLREDEA